MHRILCTYHLSRARAAVAVLSVRGVRKPKGRYHPHRGCPGRWTAPPHDRSHTQLDAGGSSSPAPRPLLPRGGGAEGVDETVWARVGDLAGAGGREVDDAILGGIAPRASVSGATTVFARLTQRGSFCFSRFLQL